MLAGRKTRGGLGRAGGGLGLAILEPGRTKTKRWSGRSGRKATQASERARDGSRWRAEMGWTGGEGVGPGWGPVGPRWAGLLLLMASSLPPSLPPPAYLLAVARAGGQVIHYLMGSERKRRKTQSANIYPPVCCPPPGWREREKEG